MKHGLDRFIYRCISHLTQLLYGISVFLLCGIFLNPVVYIYAQSRDGYGTTPLEVLNTVVDNADTKDIIETELDKVNNTQIYGSKFKIAGTLESVRTNSAIYLQRIAFIGLTAAAMLIIYNGILLMTSPLSPEQAGKVKQKIIYIILGLLVLTGFYYLIKILLSILISVTSAV